MPLAASSYAPLLGLGCQSLLVPGCHALNHRHKEAWPEQGSSRRDSAGHISKNRAKSALTCSCSCAFACRGTSAHFFTDQGASRSTGLSRVPTRSMRRGGLPFGAFWQVALRSCTDRELSCGSGKWKRRGCDISLIPKTRSTTAGESETQPQQKATPRTP